MIQNKWNESFRFWTVCHITQEFTIHIEWRIQDLLSQIWIGENVNFFKVLGSAHNQDVFCLQNVVLLPALQSTMSSDFFLRANSSK